MSDACRRQSRDPQIAPRAYSFFRHSRLPSFPRFRHSRASVIPTLRHSRLQSFPRKRESIQPCPREFVTWQGVVDSRSPIGVGDKLRGNHGNHGRQPRNDGDHASQPRNPGLDVCRVSRKRNAGVVYDQEHRLLAEPTLVLVRNLVDQAHPIATLRRQDYEHLGTLFPDQSL